MKAAHALMSASMFAPKPYVAKPERVYDYIVIGAGSGGSVMASRLAQKGLGSVLLVENGPRDSFPPWNINMPSALGFNLQTTQVNWHYETVPQSKMNNRRLYHPRGKTIGGSSSINGMVWIRGHPMDFDRWASEIKSENWNYKNCLPYFKKSESAPAGEDALRGRDGPIKLSRQGVSYSESLIRAYLKACENVGHKYTSDFNGSCQEGYGSYDRSIYNGKRQSTKNYIKMISQHPNRELLSVLPGHFASRLMFDNNRADGVEINKVFPSSSNETMRVRARKEIIVCAGAFNTPKLLMLSGIGPSETLKKNGIPVVAHLPGVGQNLQDHLELYVQHYCKKPVSLYGVTSSFMTQATSFVQWAATGTGVLGTAHLDFGAFLKTNPKMPHPDVQLHFLPFAVMDHGRVEPSSHVFQVHAGTLRAHSKGYLTLVSPDPRLPPLIDPKYLTVEQDLLDLAECVRISRRIFADSAMDEFRGDEILPGSRCTDEKSIHEFVRNHAETAYHPCGTCKMGPDSDPMSVLAPDMTVYGVKGLRVVDASAMPSVTSGNLNSVVIMMGEKCADMIN